MILMRTLTLEEFLNAESVEMSLLYFLIFKVNLRGFIRVFQQSLGLEIGLRTMNCPPVMAMLTSEAPRPARPTRC